MLDIAFKEWAVVCRALADARQTVILRKGGISEEQGEFRPEYNRFWLYPTYVHQQETGIRPEFREQLAEVQKGRPREGQVILSHYVEVAKVWYCKNLSGLEKLTPFHILSEATVRQRFEYRTPGLYVLAVNTFRVTEPHILVESPAYAGCKTWVQLEKGLPDDAAQPTLQPGALQQFIQQLDSGLSEPG